MAWHKIELPGFPAPAHHELLGDITTLASCPALGTVRLFMQPEAVDGRSIYYFYAEKPDEVGWFIERYAAERCSWPDTEKLQNVGGSQETDE